MNVVISVGPATFSDRGFWLASMLRSAMLYGRGDQRGMSCLGVKPYARRHETSLRASGTAGDAGMYPVLLQRSLYRSDHFRHRRSPLRNW